MIKAFMFSLLLGWASPVVTYAQSADCVAPEQVFADLMKEGLTGVELSIRDEGSLNILKEYINKREGIPIESMTFDRVDIFGINEQRHPELTGLVWVTLYRNGCYTTGFPETITEFEIIKGLVSG